MLQIRAGGQEVWIVHNRLVGWRWESHGTGQVAQLVAEGDDSPSPAGFRDSVIRNRHAHSYTCYWRKRLSLASVGHRGRLVDGNKQVSSMKMRPGDGEPGSSAYLWSCA